MKECWNVESSVPLTDSRTFQEDNIKRKDRLGVIYL